MEFRPFPSPISRSQVSAIVAYIPKLEAIAPGEVEIVKAQESDGVVLFSHEYHPAVDALQRALLENGFVQVFDWSAWHSEATNYLKSPRLLEQADLNTCIRLLTFHMRTERFCEGHFGSVVGSGHILAILRRLSQLNETAWGRSSGSST